MQQKETFNRGEYIKLGYSITIKKMLHAFFETIFIIIVMAVVGIALGAIEVVGVIISAIIAGDIVLLIHAINFFKLTDNNDIHLMRLELW